MTPRFSRPQQRITGRRARVASPNPGRCPRSRPAGPRAGASHSPGAPARPPSRRAHLRRRPPPERSSSQPCALGSAGPQNGSQRGPRDPGHSPTLSLGSRRSFRCLRGRSGLWGRGLAEGTPRGGARVWLGFPVRSALAWGLAREPQLTYLLP